MSDKESLQTFIEAMLAAARDCFERDSYLEPVALLLAPGNKVFGLSPKTLGIPLKGAWKDPFAALIREMVRKNEVQAVLMLVQAWIAQDDTQAGAWLEEHGSLAKYPQRQEGFATLEVRGGQTQKAWQAVIIREDDEKPRIKQFEPLPDSMAWGRMVDWFDQRPQA